MRHLGDDDRQALRQVSLLRQPGAVSTFRGRNRDLDHDPGDQSGGRAETSGLNFRERCWWAHLDSNHLWPIANARSYSVRKLCGNRNTRFASPNPDNYSFTQIVFCLQSEIAEQISRDHTKTHTAVTELAIRTSLSSSNVSRPGSRNVTARDGNKVLLAAMAHY